MIQVLIITRCPICGRENDILVDRVGYENWKSGELIQKALPELSPSGRELLMTGIDKCWDKL